VAAVVIEDKTFPKDTSLLAGGRQDLVRVKELQGKVAAARATGSERDLLAIARTEALIADLGLEEALKRAHAYAEADMILVHSKQKTPEEIVAFARRWLTAHPRPRREAVNAQVRLNSGANCRLIVARPPETSSEGKIVTAEIHRAKNSGDRRSVRNTAHRLSIGTGGSLSTNPLFVVSGRISRPPSDSCPSHASAGRVAPAFRNEVLAEAV
jgi:hypothetical protein